VYGICHLISPKNSFHLAAPSHGICEANESSEETVQTLVVSVVDVSADTVTRTSSSRHLLLYFTFPVAMVTSGKPSLFRRHRT
jgi:hypothetical protein